MQLICETLFPPRMSMTITFLTYSSYTSQTIAVVTTAPVYLFIARQSHNALKFNRLYLAISKSIYFWFSPTLSAVQGLQSQLQPEVPHNSGPISKFYNGSQRNLYIGRQTGFEGNPEFPYICTDQTTTMTDFRLHNENKSTENVPASTKCHSYEEIQLSESNGGIRSLTGSTKVAISAHRQLKHRKKLPKMLLNHQTFNVYV